MTIRYSVDVFCDRCGDWTHGATSNDKQRLASYALEKVKKQGWSRATKSMYLDLCPPCLKENLKDPK
jgi:hypothetical protein